MYCPKINYCFNEEDVRALNKRIKEIANNYNDDQTGWFEVDEKQHLIFVDKHWNTFTIYLRGRFWRKYDPEFELEVVELVKDGIVFSFETDIFDDHI